MNTIRDWVLDRLEEMLKSIISGIVSVSDKKVINNGLATNEEYEEYKEMMKNPQGIFTNPFSFMGKTELIIKIMSSDICPYVLSMIPISLFMAQFIITGIISMDDFTKTFENSFSDIVKSINNIDACEWAVLITFASLAAPIIYIGTIVVSCAFANIAEFSSFLIALGVGMFIIGFPIVALIVLIDKATQN